MESKPWWIQKSLMLLISHLDAIPKSETDSQTLSLSDFYTLFENSNQRNTKGRDPWNAWKHLKSWWIQKSFGVQKKLPWRIEANRSLVQEGAKRGAKKRRMDSKYRGARGCLIGCKPVGMVIKASWEAKLKKKPRLDVWRTQGTESFTKRQQHLVLFKEAVQFITSFKGGCLEEGEQVNALFKKESSKEQVRCAGEQWSKGFKDFKGAKGFKTPRLQTATKSKG